MSEIYSRRREIVLVLRLIAATAEKLAADLEGNRLWEGDYDNQVSLMQRNLRELPAERGR